MFRGKDTKENAVGGERNWKWRDQLGGHWTNSAERCSESELGQEGWAGGMDRRGVAAPASPERGGAGSGFFSPSALSKMPLPHWL